jgi:PAS domain S-box-containing protein
VSAAPLPASILLVEHLAEELESLGEALAPLGYPVVRATSGLDVREELFRSPWSCVVADVQAPGLEVVAPLVQRVPFLLLTSIPREEALLLKGCMSGAMEYLLKPVTPDVLRARVRALIERFLPGPRTTEPLRGEERLRTFVEATSIVLWSADATGNVVEDSPSWRAFTGQRYEEWRGHGWLNAIHPEDQRKAHEAWLRAYHSRGFYEVEYRLRRKEGGYSHVLARGVPSFNPDGSVREWVGTVADITERKQAEKELRDSEERFRAVIASLTEGIILQDAWGGLRLVNASAERLLGLSREQLAERSFQDPRWQAMREDGTPLLPEEHPPLVALRTGQPQYDQEIGIQHPEGRRVWLSVNAQPLFEADGRTLAGVVSSFFDITASKRATEERERILQELAEAVRTRDEFLSVASHELKTPLTPLSIKLQALARSAEAKAVQPERMAKDVEVMRRQVKRLSDLVNDLLDVSRISTGRLQLELDEVDLSLVVREVVSQFEPQAVKAGCLLELRTEERVVGRWDRLRVEQVVVNLLSNALKYGAGKPVYVRVEAEGGWARLQVRDEGIGIAPEHLGRIFGKFERAVSERHYGGLGLGLYITRQVVEWMGGSVSAESHLGQGATFRVELPLEGPSPTPPPPPRER